jgi:hypothetical protein
MMHARLGSGEGHSQLAALAPDPGTIFYVLLMTWLHHSLLQAGLKMQDVHYATYPVDNVSELRSTLHALLEGSQVRQQLQQK